MSTKIYPERYEKVLCDNCGKFKQGYSICCECSDETIMSWAGADKVSQQRITALEAELTTLRERYTKKCGKCGGSGYFSIHSSEKGDYTEPCPTCEGTGRVPRAVLPEWVMNMISIDDYYFVDENTICISRDSGCIYIKLTRQPDGSWELEEVKE